MDSSRAKEGEFAWKHEVGHCRERRQKECWKNISFFVIEFGEKWKAKDLFFEFKELGEIAEVIIPPRRDRKGRRYGFVLYTIVSDEMLLATKLDNIILDGRKIFANIPRFQRNLKEVVYRKEEPSKSKAGRVKAFRKVGML